MTRIPPMMALMVVVFAATQASAVDSIARHPITKHQVHGQITACMKRRMYADRAVSYNEAARVCKNQVSRQNAASASGPLVASDTPAK